MGPNPAVYLSFQQTAFLKQTERKKTGDNLNTDSTLGVKDKGFGVHLDLLS